MSSAEQMRRVIEHATGHLEDALAREHQRSYPSTKTVAALAYSTGVMRLLASYLVVTDDHEPDHQRDERLAEAETTIAELRADLAELRAKTGVGES